MAAIKVINFGNFKLVCKHRTPRTDDIDNCNIPYGAPETCCEEGCPFYANLPPLNLEGVRERAPNK